MGNALNWENAPNESTESTTYILLLDIGHAELEIKPEATESEITNSKPSESKNGNIGPTKSKISFTGPRIRNHRY